MIDSSVEYESLIRRLCENLTSDYRRHFPSVYKRILSTTTPTTSSYDFHVLRRVDQSWTGSTESKDQFFRVIRELEAATPVNSRLCVDSIVDFLISFVDNGDHGHKTPNESRIRRKDSRHNQHKHGSAVRSSPKIKHNLSMETPPPTVPVKLTTNHRQIIKEMLYAMQGIDGRYFRRNHSTKEVDLLIPDTLDRSIRTQILRFIQCGYLHSLLIESVNGIDRSSLMWQAFSLYIREELNVYHAHLGTIEKFLPKEGNGLFITQLHMCLLEPLNRLKALAALCDVVEKSKTEESLLTTLYRFAQFGSRLFEDIGNSALRICCLPMYRSIYEWMIRGSLRESFHDFFIEQENSNYDEHGLGDDEEFEWNKKFTVCEQLIPCFISEDQINKIFVAGKSVYFLRNVCKAWSASSLISQINPEITQEDVHSIYDQSDLKFSKFIETSYTNAASNLLRVLSTDYKMRKHFRNIKDYILLGQGDFIRLLMDLVRVELNQSAVKVRIHTLRAALQSAFRFTTTEYGDDEHDCSNMVDIRLFGANHGELGWDIFSLDYNITGPLLTVFPESTRLKYLRIFNFMWRLRRVEFTLGFLWKDLMSLNRKFKVRDESVAKIFQLVNLTCSLVLHFISQMNGYMFQVLESSWHDFFFTQLPHAQDLSEVIASNNEFIQQAFSKLALRSDDLTTGDDELNKYILEALSTCLDFEGTVRKLIKITSSETSENRNILAALRILSDEINSHVSDMKENIDSLIRLARRPCCDIGLKFLIFRLNFNDFYRRSYDM